MIQAEEKEAVIQWERFINFNRLVNTVAYVQRALNKHKTTTLVVNIEKEKKQKEQSSSYYSKNSLVKRWNLWKLKRKCQKAAKIYILPFPRWRRIYSSPRQNRQKSVGLQCKTSKVASLETSCGWIILAKWAQGQSTRRHWSRKKHCSAEDLDPRHMERLKINQEQVCYLQKRQGKNDSNSNGRSTRRAVRCFNSLYKCWSWILWPFQCEDWANKPEAMVWSRHLSNYESGAYRI